MKPVSSRFLAALRGSHTATFRVRVLTTFQTGTDPSGTEVDIVTGSVTLDGTANERGSLDLTLDSQAGQQWPANQFGVLTPFGNEMFVERGIAGLDPGDPDTTEYVPLGYFRIETIEQDDAPRSPIRITARDRMAAIIEARMLEPRTFAAGTTFLEVFENLVLEVYPSAVLDIDNEVASSTLREPATVEEDRYAFLRDMATSRGRVMFFDHRGVLVVAPEPDSTTPVFTVNEGQDGVLINLRRQLSRAGVYNAVVAEGTEADINNEEPPARAVVFDDNPDSATYFFGPFGQVPRFYSSPFIFTDTQAQSAAASILARTTGIPYTLDITAIPNPALEPLDPIRVIFEAGREEIHVIDVITIPLTSDRPMTISSRSLVQFIAGGTGTEMSGGIESIIEDGGVFYRVHTFTSSGTLTVVRGGEVEYLVVAAGGGSEPRLTSCGGGGGGGVLQGSGLLIESNQSIAVGSGVVGGKGQNSSIGSLVVAEGGGLGANAGNGGDGGSGGGGASASGSATGGAGVVGQGNDGGDVINGGAGGGGGAGAAGGSSSGSSQAGDGGDGIQSSITGTPTFYGGGGGGRAPFDSGSGGAGGGGAPGQNGVANTGGGAGGSNSAGSGLSGGSGIVVIRYPIQ